jgi:competence protein ComEC
MNKQVSLDSFTSKTHYFSGKVLNFSQQNRYLVQIQKIDNKLMDFNAWFYVSKKMLPGEIWQWRGTMRMKRSLENPGYSSIWFKPKFRHIESDIYFLSDLNRVKEVGVFSFLTHVRIFIYQSAYQYLQDDFARSTFLALILGLGSELDSLDWNLFKSTGTVHLMVISGAHLSLLMGFIFKFVEFIGKMYPNLFLYCPLKRLASFISLGVGFIYVLLSGCTIPVLRAWLMMFFGCYQYIGNRQIAKWQAFRWALIGILIYEPHALWYPGAYLSFLAVGVLIFFSEIKLKFKILQSIGMQFACLIGLSPLTILWFHSFPTLGLVANLIAIPWVSYAMLPLAFLLSVFPFVWGYQLYTLSSHGFFKFLSFLQTYDIYNLVLSWSNDAYAWLVLFAGMLVLWFPIRILLSFFLLVLILCVVPHQPKRAVGELWADVIDVGQGLSVMLRTANHQLLFDTGGKFKEYVIADKTLVPYLKYEHINSIDKIVISHPDSDHRGGLERIQELYPNAKLVVDAPQLYKHAFSCFKAKDWCWDGVCFQFLKYGVQNSSKNNHSCVLRVYNSKFQFLLTGDIEKPAEFAIIRKYSKVLASSILLVPHHGSNSSSSYWFLDQVKAQLGIISVGKHNIYHLPHPNVIKRFAHFHIPLVRTSDNGMIRIIMSENKWHYFVWGYKNWLDHWIF